MLQKLSSIEEVTFNPKSISKIIDFQPNYSSNSSFIKSKASDITIEIIHKNTF